MSQVVNLRRARKQKTRNEKARTAEENRAKFGRSKSDRVRQASETTKERERLDGQRLVHPTATPGEEES